MFAPRLTFDGLDIHGSLIPPRLRWVEISRMVLEYSLNSGNPKNWIELAVGNLIGLDITGENTMVSRNKHWNQPNEGRNMRCMILWVCLNIEYVPNGSFFLTCSKASCFKKKEKKRFDHFDTHLLWPLRRHFARLHRLAPEAKTQSGRRKGDGSNLDIWVCPKVERFHGKSSLEKGI